MHGGARLGSGRKSGFAAKQAEDARKYVSQRVSDEIEVLTDVLIQKAKDGDMRAMNMLFNRAWGRPRQEIQLTKDYEQEKPSEAIIKLAEALNA